MNETIFQKLYDQVLNGIPFLGTPQEVAAGLTSAETAVQKSNDLIAQYSLLNGGIGFTMGVPGYALLPLTLPTNIALATLLQLHLCATIATLAGEDPADERVRRLCLRCVTGDETADEGKELLERTGIKLSERGVRLLAEQATRVAGQAVKRLPLVGGLLGAGSDMAMTQTVGQRAKEQFLAVANSLDPNQEPKVAPPAAAD